MEDVLRHTADVYSINMEKNEIGLLAGLIAALIWLAACMIIEGKNRKYAIWAGVMTDIVLFIICKNCKMLFIGVLGGLLCGLLPGFGGSLRKYEMAVREMKGIGNWTVVSIILFIMIFMTIAIAYPELKVEF